MVHVKGLECPCINMRECGSRGKPTTEFYINGKPQTYCNGWQDGMTDEVIDVCRNCKDWVYGEQCEKDWENYRNSEQYKIDHSEDKENGYNECADKLVMIEIKYDKEQTDET